MAGVGAVVFSKSFLQHGSYFVHKTFYMGAIYLGRYLTNPLLLQNPSKKGEKN